MIQKMDRHYTTLICGATFGGIGALLASPDDTLMVERTAMVGGEFIEAINPGRQGSLHFSTSFGRRINEELVARNLIEPAGGAIHLPALHPVLCRKLLDASASILLLTEVISIKPHERGYEVTICNAAGWQVFTASNILDTTTLRTSCPPQQETNPVVRSKSVARSLNAYILSNEKELALPPIEHPRVELVQGRFASEHILKWRMAPDDPDDSHDLNGANITDVSSSSNGSNITDGSNGIVDFTISDNNWLAARKDLVGFWAARPASLQPWTIAATATEFEYDAPVGASQIDERWHWLPSASYDHPLSAMEQGFIYRAMEAEIDNGNL